MTKDEWEGQLRDIALHCVVEMPRTRPQFERVMKLIAELWEWRARTKPDAECSDVVSLRSVVPPQP
jgi:hypothetical protein